MVLNCFDCLFRVFGCGFRFVFVLSCFFCVIGFVFGFFVFVVCVLKLV